LRSNSTVAPGRSRASDDRVTRPPNDCNVEDRHDLIAAVRRRGRNGRCGCHRESVGSYISNARCRWRNRCRGGCGSGFNWRLPFAREARDKCRTTCCSKREKRDGYSAYRYGGHGRQPVAKSLARQHPLKSMVRRAPGCSQRNNPAKVWRFWRRCAGPRHKFCRYSRHSVPISPPKMDGIEPFVRWGRRGSGGLAMHGVMRALIARWAALIAMLGLLALVIATSRIPCVPYGLWPALQMHCR
jgi:hypothetical protein